MCVGYLFHPFTLRWCLLRCVSWTHQKVRSCFSIFSVSLCLFTEEVRPLIPRVFVSNVYGLLLTPIIASIRGSFRGLMRWDKMFGGQSNPWMTISVPPWGSLGTFVQAGVLGLYLNKAIDIRVTWVMLTLCLLFACRRFGHEWLCSD